jgi:predicted transport protein
MVEYTTVSKEHEMPIYAISNNVLTEIPVKDFKLEREIQALFEANLKNIMGLTLVKSEFPIKNKRIDTLAFDEQSRGFVIIEYKRDANISVFDQGVTYLKLMLENKEVFIVEYNERLKRNLKRNDVDWSQTRVIFVSTTFTDNQIDATDFRDLAIELWKVTRYDNNTLHISEIKKTRSAESIKQVTQQSKDLKLIASEIKIYSEDGWMTYAGEEMAALYKKFRTAITNLDNGIEIKVTKCYIAFKKGGKNIVAIEPQQKALKIFVYAKWGTIEDSKKIAKDVSNIGHYGNGEYQIQVRNDRDLEYIMSLVKQAI